jgi:hypothetical protein
MQMNNLLIVAGYDATTNIYAYYSSDIGKTWTGVSQPVANQNIYTIIDMKMISQTTAMMVGMSPTTSLTLISTNGITWTRINTAVPGLLNQIYSFSGTYSEIVLNCDPPTTNTQIMGQANPNQRLTLSNKYTSNINAVPTYINIPYVNVTFPSGVTQIPITITLTQKSSTSTSSTPVATGTFTLLPANATTYTTTGISIPLKLESSSSYIVSGYTVTYTLSVTSDAIGTGSMQVQYNFGLTATLHGRTYFLPSTLTLPTATSGGTQWYIPSPIVYYPSKTIYGNKIKTSVPSIAANNGLITYTTTSTGTGSLGFGTYGTSSVEMLKLTLGSVPATINVIASYPGNNAYAATSVTKTVYTKDYVPVSPQTAMFLNKSGLTGSSVNPTSIGNGGTTSTAASIVVILNVTDNVTLNEFNFGCKSLLGLAGYLTTQNGAQFTMTVKNGSTIVTTVVFTVIIPPPGAQIIGAQYYAATYEQNETNWGANDGMLLSIPFYNISSDLPTYVTSFSVTGTPSPQFKLGDTIQISLAANAPFVVYTDGNTGLCGALIATPAVNPSPYVPSIYNNPLPSIAYEGSDTYSSPVISTNGGIGSCPAILVTAKTMLTGFLIENIGDPSVAHTAQLQFVVYNQSTNVLAINIQCTLPVFNANPMRPLYIPFSYASQQNNTTANAIAIQYIAFSGTQNPIFEIGSNVSFRLISINTSNTSYKYHSAGSPNYSTFVSTAYGTAMLANTNLAVTASVTPVQMTSGPKTIQFTSTTTPANVGSAITYASRISASIGSVNSSTGVLTIGGGNNNNMVRATVTASQAAGPLYNPATASASVDIIGDLSSSFMTNIGTNTGSVAQSMTNNPSLNGYFIDVNIPLATTITGISFQYSGIMTGSTPGNTTTIRMTLAKSNNPTAVLASTTFTYTDNYNTNDDGTLFIIPFVNGNAFNTDTHPITVMPTKILTVSGSVSTLAFDTGDAIRITLINASSPLNGNVVVYTATANPTNSTLACSVISTVTASSYPFTTSLFVNNPVSPISLGNSIPSGYNNFPSSITSQIQVNFPNFSTAIIATGFTIPVQMNSHGTYDGQLVLLYSAGGGAILVIDFILVATSTMSSPYINLQFPFNMPIGNDMGSKTWAQNQYYARDGGYYITNVKTQNNTAPFNNINNGFLNISSNPRLGSASAAATGACNYVILGLSGSFKYQIAPPGNTVCSLYGSTLTTQN